MQADLQPIFIGKRTDPKQPQGEMYAEMVQRFASSNLSSFVLNTLVSLFVCLLLLVELLLA